MNKYIYIIYYILYICILYIWVLQSMLNFQGVVGGILVFARIATSNKLCVYICVLTWAGISNRAGNCIEHTYVYVNIHIWYCAGSNGCVFVPFLATHNITRDVTLIDALSWIHWKFPSMWSSSVAKHWTFRAIGRWCDLVEVKLHSMYSYLVLLQVSHKSLSPNQNLVVEEPATCWFPVWFSWCVARCWKGSTPTKCASPSAIWISISWDPYPRVWRTLGGEAKGTQRPFEFRGIFTNSLPRFMSAQSFSYGLEKKKVVREILEPFGMVEMIDVFFLMA